MRETFDLKLLGGDLDFEGNQLNLIGGVPWVRQAIETNLRLVEGEWFLDPTAGVPYFDEILGKPSDLGPIRKILRDTVMSVPHVTGVPLMNLAVDRAARILNVTFTATTDLGEDVSGSFFIEQGGQARPTLPAPFGPGWLYPTPHVVRNLVATPGDGSMDLSWDPPDNAIGAGVYRYHVVASEGTTLPTGGSYDVADPFIHIDSLGNGETYTFTVYAVGRAKGDRGKGPAVSIDAVPGGGVARTTVYGLMVPTGVGAWTFVDVTTDVLAGVTIDEAYLSGRGFDWNSHWQTLGVLPVVGKDAQFSSLSWKLFAEVADGNTWPTLGGFPGGYQNGYYRGAESPVRTPLVTDTNRGTLGGGSDLIYSQGDSASPPTREMTWNPDITWSETGQFSDTPSWSPGWGGFDGVFSTPAGKPAEGDTLYWAAFIPGFGATVSPPQSHFQATRNWAAS